MDCMNNPPQDESYKNLEREAKLFYKGIRRVFRPSWGEYISFNTEGFRHLIWKGNRKRKENERVKRLDLLPYASIIIADGKLSSIRKKKKIERVKQYGRREKRESSAKFWAFSDIKDGKKITVVVRQIGSGNKHFFSIFEDHKNKKLP